MSEPSLKWLTARSVKWNAIDRLSSQVLYAATGIILANILTPQDFGLVGAILIFQAFASLFVDSGFSYALIQRKSPTDTDYSSVLWFNMAMSIFIYLVLWLGAPLIAACFEHDQRLIPMSRVMFLTFILNASSIVQVNRLTKQMNVKPIAVANIVSLLLAGITGVWLAVVGFGAWAIVWQSIVNTGSKSLILWISTRWVPRLEFSWTAIRSFFRVGGSMMATSFLNTAFQNIYSFFIGNRDGLSNLGYYTQSDKWSKMGIMSLLQTLTSSFLPPLSAVQDDAERFRRLCNKMNRMTAYLLFPIMIGLIIMAAPIFHTLFGNKWDASIGLFQLLLIRGIFTVLTGVYNNYILSRGKSGLIVKMEMIRDIAALAALLLTLPYLSLSTPDDIVYGIKIMLWGQILASVLAWVITLVSACRVSGNRISTYLIDLAPYLGLSLLISPVLIWIGGLQMASWLVLTVQIVVGALLYLGLNYILHSHIQEDAMHFIMGKMKK